MILCPKCNRCEWDMLVRHPVDPAKDKFYCKTCGTLFLRYSTPLKVEEVKEEKKF